MIQVFLLFCSLWKFLANIFAEILASFWTFFLFIRFSRTLRQYCVWATSAHPSLFCSLWKFLANIFAEILASFWTFLFDFREHYDNIVFTSTFRTFSWSRRLHTFYILHLHFANIFVKYLASLLIFSEHFRRDFSKFLDFFIRFSRTLRQLYIKHFCKLLWVLTMQCAVGGHWFYPLFLDFAVCGILANIFVEILASFWTFFSIY